MRRSLIPLILAVTAVGDTCVPVPEILYVQDASASLRDTKLEVANSFVKISGRLKDSYRSVRFGVAAFVDKPIPFRGYGHRNVLSELDSCYELRAALTSDLESIDEALSSLPEMSGGDGPENPYEALLDAATDPQANWTAVGSFGPSGESPVRVAVIVTDDMPHMEGEAGEGITRFNMPRYPVDAKIGGFGHPSLAYEVAGVLMSDTPPLRPEDYLAFCDAWYHVDSGRATSDDYYNYNNGLATFGPSSWEQVKAHPGTFVPGNECYKYEYPSLTRVGEALRAAQIIPVFLLTRPLSRFPGSVQLCRDRGYETEDMLDCMMKSYNDDLKVMGVTGVVASFSTPEDIEEILRSTIAQVVDIAGCQPLPPPTSFPESATSLFTQPSATEASGRTGAGSATEPPSTEVPESVTFSASEASDKSDAGPATEVSGPATEVSSSEVIASSFSAASNSGSQRFTSSAESSTTTTHRRFPTQPWVPLNTDTAATDSSEDSGAGGGVIAGATAGSAAGVAAIAGFIYKRFGGNWLRSPDDAMSVEQMDTHDASLDREAMEEVTMDMFQ